MYLGFGRVLGGLRRIEQVRDNLSSHRDDLRGKLDAMREQELEQRKKIRGLESQADEVSCGLHESVLLGFR